MLTVKNTKLNKIQSPSWYLTSYRGFLFKDTLSSALDLDYLSCLKLIDVYDTVSKYTKMLIFRKKEEKYLVFEACEGLLKEAQKQYQKLPYRDFPGGPVAKTLHSQCRGPRFDPWSGNWIPHAKTKSSHATAKEPTHHNKDRGSCMLQLRPGAAT